MAGYNYRRKMSNNAVAAYKMGTKPFDEWRRSEIINHVQKIYDPQKHHFTMDKLKSIPLKALKMCTLSFSSWHHTTREYIETDFYFVDGTKLLTLTDKDIDKYVEYVKKNP